MRDELPVLGLAWIITGYVDVVARQVHQMHQQDGWSRKCQEADFARLNGLLRNTALEDKTPLWVADKVQRSICSAMVGLV